MKPIKIIIIILFLFDTNLLSAQNDNKIKNDTNEFNSLIHQRIYQLNIGKHQALKLLEFKNGEFEGSLINSAFKMDRKNNLELMTVKINVPVKTVKILMDELKEKQFENIPDCKEIKNCIDGTSSSFNTIHFTSITDAKFHKYYYWKTESDYNNKALSRETAQVRELLSIINNEINLEKEFQNFVSRLPIGKYTYDGIIITKKTKISFLD